MKITLIGAGEMGGALARGLLCHDAQVGSVSSSSSVTPWELTISSRTAARLVPFASLGATVTTDNVTAVQGADVVILAVKPMQAEAVLTQIKDVLQPHQTVVSVVAGLTLVRLHTLLSSSLGTPLVVVAMPNTAAAVRASMSFVSFAEEEAESEAAQRVRTLFCHLGEMLEVPEQLLPAGNGLAGCGIAFAMRYVRAAMEAGVELGLTPHQALQATLQTMQGAVSLLRHTGAHPEEEIDHVTTPGGLTIRGLHAMERMGFSAAVMEGIMATSKR